MPSFVAQGLKIAYIDVPAGRPERGEPIILLHGFASNHAVNWVNTQWVKTLSEAGRRVVALDNRGHGASDKPHEAAAYASDLMAGDALHLCDHLALPRFDVMGYSMGARIAAYLRLAGGERVRSLILGGLGDHLFSGVGLPIGIAEAMEAPALESLTDRRQRMFRAFAEQTGNDLAALAACIRGSRQVLSLAQLQAITCPVLVAVGSKDDIAGDAKALAALLPAGEAVDIPDRDHNLAVGDKVYKAAALSFLVRRP
jgi:pimeloyl-ACP methyl ester carboxylesterase